MEKFILDASGAASVDAYAEYHRVVGDDDGGTMFTEQEYAGEGRCCPFPIVVEQWECMRVCLRTDDRAQYEPWFPTNLVAYPLLFGRRSQV